MFTLATDKPSVQDNAVAEGARHRPTLEDQRRGYLHQGVDPVYRSLVGQ